MDIDILHLKLKPPFAPGSITRLIDDQLRSLPDFTQHAIAFSNQTSDVREVRGPAMTLVDGNGLKLWQRAFLLLPERIRRRGFNQIGGRKHLIYLWKVTEILSHLNPRVIVFYDEPKMAPLLRSHVRRECRFVLSQHGLSYFLNSNDASRIYSLKSFDVVWTLTHASYRLERARLSQYEPLVSVIPNGVDVDVFKPASVDEKRKHRRTAALSDDALVVLLLSRNIPKKGAHVVVDCWSHVIAKVPNALLWIVGGMPDDYEAYLANLCAASGIRESVRFEGRVPPAQAARCFAAADVYVFPSLFVEGHALSLLEAMASGLACVASDHHSVREYYTDAEVMTVPDPNIAGQFVAPLIALLEDAPLRSRMGLAARALVEKRFSRDLWLSRLRDFYARQLSLAT